MAGRVRVYLEVGAKRVFAGAADWPGWCRSGKTEAAAMASLEEYRRRYAPVAALAGLQLPSRANEFETVESVPGNATTDFGAPGVPTQDEGRKLTAASARRIRSLVEACWTYLDQVRSAAPAELRKGPRGGGRDREEMYEHVLGAEVEYAKRLGVRLKQPEVGDARAVKAFRKGVLDAMVESNTGQKWPVAYCARRIAWHALDHAWEIQDRIP